jgi:hypothetical protein
VAETSAGLRLRISGGLAARYKPSYAEPALWFPRLAVHRLTSHCGIIQKAWFLMLTVYRPYPMSIVRVWLWSEFYLVTLVVDKLTGFNYGFLLHKPEAFSI